MFFPIVPPLEEKLYYIQDRIHKTAIKVGRNPEHITLVAVTKTMPLEIWEQAFNANLTTLGESRIQETQEKVDRFKKRDQIEKQNVKDSSPSTSLDYSRQLPGTAGCHPWNEGFKIENFNIFQF